MLRIRKAFKKAKKLSTIALALLLAAGVAIPTSIYVAAAPGDVEINETNFPDENFRNFLLATAYGEDGVITQAEIAGITGLWLTNKSISSLTGIEHFTALERLCCNNNPLTTLDVSHNTALTYLECINNQLTTLTVSGLTALTDINCTNNQLTTLDVSGCTALKELWCRENQLTELDVSNNTALETLYCGNNNISILNLSQNTALEALSFGGNNLSSLSFVRASGNTVTINGNGATFTDYYGSDTSTSLGTAGLVVTSTSPDKPITSWTVTGTGANASVNGTKSSLYFATSGDSTFTANWTAPHTGDAYISALVNEGALDVPMINKKSNFWHATMKLYSDETQSFEAFCIDLGKHGRLGNEFWSSGAFTGDPLINKIVKAKTSGALDYKEAQVLIWGVQEGVVSDENDMTELLTQLGASNVAAKVAAVTSAGADTIYLWTNIYGTSNYQRFVSYLEPDNIKTTFDPIVDPSTWYHIAYDGNGNDGGTVPADTSDYQPNEYAFVKGNSGNLTKTDKVFVGWTDNAAGTGTVYTLDDLYTVTDDVTLYAKWNSSTATHNVTYNDTGATSGTVPVDNIPYNEGDTITILGNTGNLAKDGYFFRGWKDDTSGTEYYTDDSVADEIYLYGATFRDYSLSPIWEQGYYVIYDGNTNDSGTVPVDNTLYKSGASAVALGNTGNLAKTDKVFDGWNTKADGTGTPVAVGATIYPSALDADDVVDHKATLYVMWTDAPAGGAGTIIINGVDEHTLTVREVYQDENGTVERTDTDTAIFPAGEVVTLNATAPDGYDVVGAASQTVTMDADKTVTFTYKRQGGGTGGGSTIIIGADEYTLTIKEVYQDENGNVERTDTNTIVLPADETITINTAVPNGYTAVGATSQDVRMDGDKTITFTYRKNGSGGGAGGGGDPVAPTERYTITFTDGQGNVILTETVDKGSATPIPADPTRDGYTFAGWSPSVSPTVTGNETYTATWKENEKPTITIIKHFVDKDGNSINSTTTTEQHAIGETVTITADPVDGYTVVGEGAYTFIVQGDATIQFTYQKDDDAPTPGPDPVDPEPVNPDPVNPDPVNPDPTTPTNPSTGGGGNGGTVIIPTDNGGGNGNGGNSGRITPVPVTPDDPTPNPNKPDDGNKNKPDDGDKDKPDDGDKPKPTNPDPTPKPDDPDGKKPDGNDPDGDPGDPNKPDGGKLPWWMTDDTPEAKNIRRNVAVGVISGGAIVALAATGALKYLWLLLLLLFFNFKNVKFHGILTDEKNKYIKVRGKDGEVGSAVTLQEMADMCATAGDIYNAAVASGYETTLPMGTTMTFEYADRLEKMKADETKMYEVLSEAKDKVTVGLVNKAAKIDVKINFNLR